MLRTKTDCYPFLKYVGGKRKLANQIINLMPPQFETYYECFLGGGAVFFAQRPKKAALSDSNEELINSYLCLRDRESEGQLFCIPQGYNVNLHTKNVTVLIELLEEFENDYQKNLKISLLEAENYYYQIRSLDRDSDRYCKLSEVERAARYIFLNKTGYSGLMRVNSFGQINTPFGKYLNPRICDRANLINCSEALQDVEISCAVFEPIFSNEVDPGDFVYADPPYFERSNKTYNQYGRARFDQEQHQELYEWLAFVNKYKVNWVLSNSATDWVRDRYKDFAQHKVYRSGAINSDTNARSPVQELLICSGGLN